MESSRKEDFCLNWRQDHPNTALILVEILHPEDSKRAVDEMQRAGVQVMQSADLLPAPTATR